VNANATDVAAVAEDALVVLVMVWWWIIVPLGCLLVLVLTPWVLAAGGSAYFASGFIDPEDDLGAPGGTAPIVIGLGVRACGSDRNVSGRQSNCRRASVLHAGR